MPKYIVWILLPVLFLSLLCGCELKAKTPECAWCDWRTVPIHRIEDGEAGFYLCGECCAYARLDGWYYDGVEGCCYWCKAETKCVLKVVEKADDEYERYMLVCFSCRDYEEEHGRWPE